MFGYQAVHPVSRGSCKFACVSRLEDEPPTRLGLLRRLAPAEPAFPMEFAHLVYLTGYTPFRQAAIFPAKCERGRGRPAQSSVGVAVPPHQPVDCRIPA